MNARALTLIGLGLIGLAACGPEGSGPSPTPARRSDAISLGSLNGCRIDDDCAAAHFCFQNRCVAECQSDEDCAEGGRCSARARCIRADVDGGLSAADEEAAAQLATDLGGITLSGWPENSRVEVRPAQPFVELTLQSSAPVPGGGFLYTVQQGSGGQRKALRATGTTSFTLTLPTGSAGADVPEPQPVQVVTPMGSRTLYLVPRHPRAGWYAGTFVPAVFGGAGLPLEFGIETDPVNALSLNDASAAWLWVPTSSESLMSLPASGQAGGYVRRPLQYDASVGAWVAMFSADELDTRALFGGSFFPDASRSFRFEIADEDGDTLLGAVADRWRGLFDQRTADGVRAPGVALVSGSFRLSRSGALPQGKPLFDGQFAPITPKQRPAPNVSACESKVFTWCNDLGSVAAFEAASPGARAECAIAVADQVLAGPTVGKTLTALIDPTIPDHQGMNFQSFIEACASESSPQCKPTPELMCARALVAHAYLDASAADVGALSRAYDLTTKEAFLGRQLAAFQVDTQTRLKWLQGSEAPPFLASTLRDYNQQILDQWRAKVLQAHLEGVFGQLDAAGLAVLTRSPSDPVAISNRQALLLDLSNSWRAAMDALVLLTSRWNVLLQATGPRADAAAWVRTTATRLYVTAAILQELNRETGSSYLSSTFGSGFSVLMRELTRLSLPFDQLVFARDAEVVSSKSLDPNSNARSLLSEREDAARAAVRDAMASVDLVLDEASQTAIDEAALTARYEDQLLSLRNELISLCGLPVGCAASDVGTRPECDVPTDPGRCGFLVMLGGQLAPEGAEAPSEAGGALYGLREAAIGQQEAAEKLQALVQQASLLGATAEAFAQKVASWDLQRRSVAREVEALLGEIATIGDEQIDNAVANIRAQQALRESAYERQEAALADWDDIRNAGIESDQRKLSTINALNITSSVLGLAADRADLLAEIMKDALPETVGTATDPSFTARMGVRFPAFIASSVALTAATVMESTASSLQVTLEGEQALREAELTTLEQLPDLDKIGTENDLAALQNLIDSSNLQTEKQVRSLNALVDALQRNLQLDLAHDRDLVELRDRRDAWRMQLVDTLRLQYGVLQADLTARQKELAYYEVVQRAQLLEGRFRSMQARFGNLEALLGSPDVVFSFANRMARAESRIDRARSALEEWLVALEYYAVRPFVDQHLAILLARNPSQLEAIANELLRMQRACGGPATVETVEVSLRDDLLGMGFASAAADGTTVPASERFRALLARAQTPVNRRTPLSTTQTIGQRLDLGHVWAANFDLSVDTFANLARTCNAKLESIAVQFVGEELGRGQPVATVVYDGASQLRSCQPGIETYVAQFGPGATAFGKVTSFRTAARSVSPVAGLGSYGPRQTWNASLEGMPLAAGYTVLIDLDHPSNQGIAWDRLDDVRLQFRYSYQDVFPEGQCK